MNKLPIALLLALSFVAYVSVSLTSHHYESKIMSERKAALKAETERNTQLATLAEQYHEKFLEVGTAAPVVIERRVFTEGRCVPDGSAAALDDGGAATGSGLGGRDSGSVGVVMIASSKVQALADVAKKHETMYKQCAVALAAHQARYKN